MSVWIKRALLGLGALLGVVVLAAVLFVVFFPKDLAVAEMERRVEAATGRELTIGGDVELAFWPALGFSAGEVTLSNPEAFDTTEPFLAANRIVFAIAVMPLLRGQVEVKRAILEGAALNLEAGADGAANWAFPTTQTSESQATIEDLHLDDVRLIDSAISFKGAGAPLALTDVDADLALASLDAPARLNAAFEYRGQRLETHTDIATPRAVLEKGETPFVANVRAAPFNADFDGTFNAATGALEGRLNANGASLRRLMAWMGTPMAEGGGFGAYRVAARMRHEGDTTRLDDATFTLDAIETRGRIVLAAPAGGRLRLSGALASPSLDLNPYLPAPAQGAAAGGVEVNTAWSDAPLDLSGLRAFDADIAFTLGALKFQQMNFTDVAMALRVSRGALDARLSRISLYGGAGTARLIADGAARTPRVAVELDARDVQAEALLGAAIGFDRIVGRGRIAGSFVGQGASQAAIMRSLDGNASFNLNDGAWKGVNLAQVARTIQSALTGAESGAAAQTDFSELATTLTISDGVAATDNLRLLSPFIRLDGQGLIDIGGQSIDMRIAPRAVRSAQGQGGDAALQGLGVPFRVSGPWSRVRFAPALGDVVQNELRNRAREVLRDQQPGSPLATLGDALFGRAPPAEEPPAAPEGETPAATPATPAPTPAAEPPPPRQPADILSDLLRRRQKTPTPPAPAEPPAEPAPPAPATP